MHIYSYSPVRCHKLVYFLSNSFPSAIKLWGVNESPFSKWLIMATNGIYVMLMRSFANTRSEAVKARSFYARNFSGNLFLKSQMIIYKMAHISLTNVVNCNTVLYILMEIEDSKQIWYNCSSTVHSKVFFQAFLTMQFTPVLFVKIVLVSLWLSYNKLWLRLWKLLVRKKMVC